jgi:hypothetical protein
MVRLRRDLDTRFDVELIEFEKEQQMPYVTSVERVAEERGFANGEARGIARAVVRMWARSGVELPVELRERIQTLSIDILDELADASRDLTSVDEVIEWLERHNS